MTRTRKSRRLNEDAAIYFTMLKAGFKRKAKLTPVQYARRLAIEKSAQQRRYCDAFALWKTCPRKACRRHRACGGDPHGCLLRALDRVPRSLQAQARKAILKATPRNIGAPEREARQCLPEDFLK